MSPLMCLGWPGSRFILKGFCWTEEIKQVAGSIPDPSCLHGDVLEQDIEPQVVPDGQVSALQRPFRHYYE